MSKTIFILYAIFLTYFLSLNFFYLIFLILAFFGSVRRLYEERFTDFDLISRSYLTVPISIMVPAYNERLSIVNSIYSALKSNYPEFEIIVVNDGSTDNTLSVIDEEFGLEVKDIFYRQPIPTKKIRCIYRSKRFPNLWVIDKENGGKADAVNAGSNLSHYRYLMITDADSIFHPMGLLRLVSVVNLDPSLIVAIGGQIRIGNGLNVEKGTIVKKRFPQTLPARFQIVEYLGSFLGNRVGWSEINSVIVISGGFGMWRKDAFIELGGMTTETTHEDIEFTFRIHEYFRKRQIPYRIVFLPDPVVYTEVPNNWRGLFVQRRRWQRVVNEVFWRYRHMFFNPRYGSVGLVGMPYLLFYEILGPFVEFSSYAVVIFLFFIKAISLKLVLLFLLISFGLTAIVRIASVFVEQFSFRTYSIRSLPRLFLLALFENFGYHQFISVARIIALFDALKRRKTWERIERSGFSEIREEGMQRRTA